MNRPLRIIDTDFNLLAEIDNYESMFFTRSFHGIGEIEVRINRYKQHTDKLLKGNIIIIGSDTKKVFQIKHREIELGEDGKVTENWLIRGLSLKAVVGQRITIPPSTTAYDTKEGNAETVMKHYLTNNIISPVDPNRIIPQLTLSPNQNRGSSISWSSRFKNLAEDITEISLNSGLGWEVYLDIQNKKWVFDVVESNDLTVNQSSKPPVIFSPEFDSLQSLQYTESELNYKNSAYIGGAGEGIDRRIVEFGDTSGLDRHEIFVDARNVKEVDDNQVAIPEAEIIQTLTDKGQQELNKLIQEQYLEGQILTNSPFIYQVNYDLGDIATIQNKKWGVTMDSRITEIKEIYETSGYKIEAVFGNNIPTLIDKIKQAISPMDGEIRR